MNSKDFRNIREAKKILKEAPPLPAIAIQRRAYGLLEQVAVIVNRNRETDTFTEKFVESLNATMRELRN
tara:strand:+ start:417 stop:623 length:207 start_codon:yes stop_codon:yes gene_type:complete